MLKVDKRFAFGFPLSIGHQAGSSRRARPVGYVFELRDIINSRRSIIVIEAGSTSGSYTCVAGAFD